MWGATAAATLLLGGCATPESTANGSHGALAVDVVPAGVYCDGTSRLAAVVFGADGGERLMFTSPMPIEIPDGVADDQGQYLFEWACDSDESGLTWTITALVETATEAVTFDIHGSDDDPQVDRMLIFEAGPQALTCDGSGQTVGRLSNATPSELVDFASPDAERLSAGVADGKGELDVNWRCSHDQAGAVWNVTAQGRESGRMTTFTLEGTAARPPEEGGITFMFVENPLVCDGARRPVAELANLTPNIEVDFEAKPDGGSIRPGQADSAGNLTIFWECGRRDGATSWQLTARERSAAARSTTITIDGAATPGLEVSLAISEDPFRCDGTSHQFGVLNNLIPGEFVDFTSPHSDNIRQGQADPDGELPVRWQCEEGDAGTVWEVTATGQSSGGTVTFEIRGSE